MVDDALCHNMLLGDLFYLHFFMTEKTQKVVPRLKARNLARWLIEILTEII
jgi:hypothetical protein